MKIFKRTALSLALGSCFAAPAFAVPVGCGVTDTITASQGSYVFAGNCLVIDSGVTVTSANSNGALNGYQNGGAGTINDSVINYGTIDGTVGGYAVHSHATINTFENYGTILGSIHNDAGVIGTLINGQTGLHYDGILPGAYYTYFSSPNTYGTIAFANGGTLATYGLKIAAGQNYATGTYNAVITSSSALTITTQAISGVTYSLTSPDSGRTWNLVIGDVSSSRVATPTGNLGNNPALGAARVIDNNPNLLALFAPLTIDSQLSQAASQTLPALTGSTVQVTRNVLSALNNVIEARQGNNRGASSGDLFYGDRNVWIKPFGSRANQNDSDGLAGYKATTGGLVFGFDGNVRQDLRLGTAFAFSSTNVGSAIAGGGSNSMNVKAYQLIGYGSVDLNARDALDFQADIGMNRNSSKRDIAFAGTAANAGYRSWSAHLGANLNRTYALGAASVFTPSLRLDYTHVSDQAYSENGAGLLNLNVDQRNANALVLGADGRLSQQLADKWTLSTSLGAGYDLLNESNVVNSTFAGASATSFQTTGIKSSPWIIRAGLGMSYKIKAGSELALRYDADHRTGYFNQTVSARLNMPF